MNKKTLVIGDSCIDVFEYGNCKRMCPEAPVPVLEPTHKTKNYGMAYNVYENLKALGVDCDIITNTDMPVKIRYIDESSNHMIIRVDRNDNIIPLNWDTIRTINFLDYNAIVISDYNKGFINEEQINYLSNAIDITFLDTKKKIGKWCENIKFIKLNEKEFLENQSYSMFAYFNNVNVIVTLGKNGAKLFNINEGVTYKEHSYPIKNNHPVRDLTGAGDTFLSSLVANYMKSFNIDEAICFANKCAAWTVTQKGVAVVTKNKIKNKK